MKRSGQTIRSTVLGIKNALLICSVLILTFSSISHAKKPINHPSKKASINLGNGEILTQSQISYKAEGGFTGIHSFGVIISCVNGKVSVLKTLNDPSRPSAFIHQKGSMSQEAYLELWKGLKKHKVFFASNIADPKMDIADQFTMTFEAKAGDHKNEFKVHGIARPEACQHFAIKSLIDSSSHMQAFINSPTLTAQR